MAFNERNFLVDILSANAINPQTPGGTVTLSGSKTIGVPPAAATVTGASLAATVNATSFVVTTESLATAAGATAAYVITNNTIVAASNVLIEVGYGTATAGVPLVQKVVAAAGSVTVTILNLGATSPAGASLNGTLIIQGLVV